MKPREFQRLKTSNRVVFRVVSLLVVVAVFAVYNTVALGSSSIPSKRGVSQSSAQQRRKLLATIAPTASPPELQEATGKLGSYCCDQDAKKDNGCFGESQFLVADIAAYPGSSLKLRGSVIVSMVDNSTMKISYSLTDDLLDDDVKPKDFFEDNTAGGLSINTGTTCSSAAGAGTHFFNTSTNTWEGKEWGINAQGYPAGSFTLKCGHGLNDVLGRSVVITSGKANVGCGVLVNPQEEKVCDTSGLHPRICYKYADDPFINCKKAGLDFLILDNGRDAFTANEIRDGAVVLYILGSIYMFIALAIICDEFFVPALEIIVEKLEIDDEVAGATLMAAGGSAPELFTSFIGTFIESAVGFGTIVGSAVFNVLFVIAMCAMFSREVLELTWWPLFRDSVYYAVSLGVLAFFFGNVNSYDGKIEGDDSARIMWWEALILFCMYIGYCVLMKFHTRLHIWIEVTCLKKQKSDFQRMSDTDKVATDMQAKEDKELKERKNDENLRDRDDSTESVSDILKALPKNPHILARGTQSFRRPSTFRAGIYQLMTSEKPMIVTAGIHIVHQIQGSAEETFHSIDKDGNGFLDEKEFKILLEQMGSSCTKEEVKTAMQTIDDDGDGNINYLEFQRWYIRSEVRIQAELKAAFKVADTNNNGKIDRAGLAKLFELMNARPTEAQGTSAMIDDCMKVLDDNVDGFISQQEFMQWYAKSDLWKAKKQDQEDEAEEAEGLSLKFPEGCKARVIYLLLFPLTFLIYFGNPGHGPGRRALRWGLWGFFTSIAWIGVFSYLMVWWIQVIGAAFGIPDVIMGLTFLAAGTSVPDLLSSVIVARQGRGDMAVSSSIGSNIFDVLVGLPVPWLFYTIIKEKPVAVGADNVPVSIGILIGMLVLVIVTIAANGWKLTKTLGAVMMCLYVIFVFQDVFRVVNE